MQLGPLPFLIDSIHHQNVSFMKNIFILIPHPVKEAFSQCFPPLTGFQIQLLATFNFLRSAADRRFRIGKFFVLKGMQRLVQA